MTNDDPRRNDEIRMTEKHSRITFAILAFWLALAFVIRASSFLSLVNDQLVSVWIATLRHPAHRRLSLFDIEGDAAFFKFADRSVNIFHFESDCCSIARWFPCRMRTNTDCDRAKIVLDPRAVHLSGTGFQLQDLLIKFPRAFFVRNRDGDESHFVCDHLQIPFSFSGLSL